MRILHFVLILAVFILLKNVYCDSSNPLPNAPLSSLPKQFSFWRNIRWEGRDDFFSFLTHEISIKYNSWLRPTAPRTLSGPHVGAPSAPSNVTSYTLAVQWPPGVCSGTGYTCEIPIVPAEFKIHGLWPEFPKDNRPTPIEFNFQLGGLTDKLTKSWPNLFSKKQTVGENLPFWKQEWDKHGKFSEMAGLDYFQKTLELYTLFGEGLKRKLADENIIPVKAEFNLDKTYTLVQIQTALKNINGVSCEVRCVKSKLKDQKDQILEIRFSFTPDFQVQSITKSNCGPNVRFPA